MSPIDRKVRAARQAAGRSLRDLAAAAGISHVELVHIEAGRVDPRLSTVERLAKALGVSVDRLIEGSPAPARRRGSKARRVKR